MRKGMEENRFGDKTELSKLTKLSISSHLRFFMSNSVSAYTGNKQ